jgi:hypothetical protein
VVEEFIQNWDTPTPVVASPLRGNARLTLLAASEADES